MMLAGSLSDAANRRTPYFIDGRLLSYKSVIIGPPLPDHATPNAFLIEQQADTELPVHFHGYGQFQVVLKGDGKLGTHELLPVSVHYAGQRTPYGPIRPGNLGLSYLTLRPRTEGSAFFMPESRHLRGPAVIPRLEIYGDFASTSDAVNAVVDDGVRTSEVIAPMESGLAAWKMEVAAGQMVKAPGLVGGSGRFHVIVHGDLHLPDGSYDHLSVIWMDPDQEPLEFAAGAGGVQVLVLQFPRDACMHPVPVNPAVPNEEGGSLHITRESRAPVLTKAEK